MEQVSISSESVQVPEPCFMKAMRSFVKLPVKTPSPLPSTTRRVPARAPLDSFVPRSTMLPVNVMMVPAVLLQRVRPLSDIEGAVRPISAVMVTSFVGSK